MAIDAAPKFSVLIHNFNLDILDHLKNLHRDWGSKFCQIFFKFFEDFELTDIAELKEEM